ncbi:hypothetical protein SCAR479_04830 [Seiridium cardinale]|uniref:DNA polymerase epsilon subunit D n=1 Tax=Seiridium cardinale TaxID=138064 RepID=A0ABR2XX88_9PEZI
MPRKSDTARRSDASMAKTALAEGEAVAPEPFPTPASADTTAPLESTPVAADASEMDMERTSESAAPSDRKDRDAVAIELTTVSTIGPQSAKVDYYAAGKRSLAAKYPDPSQCHTSYDEGGDGVHKSPGERANISDSNSANERTMNSNKKTIMPPDVFEALDDIEYPEFKDLVQQEFKKFNEVQSSKRNTYRRKVAAAKKGVPYVDTPGLLREPRVPEATGPPGTTFIEDPAAAAGIDTSRSIKKQRMSSTNPANGNADDSAMTSGDADTTQEYQDAESEPDEPIDEDEDEPEDDVEEEEEEEEDEDGGDEDDEMHDALEEREEQDGEDEALDNGEDSDS